MDSLQKLGLPHETPELIWIFTYYYNVQLFSLQLLLFGPKIN